MAELLVASVALAAFVFMLTRTHLQRIQKIEAEVEDLKAWAAKPRFFGAKKEP
jgi:hypothetical protein